jgi:SCP-2 sterol transfer family
LHGMQEVAGSSPASSITIAKPLLAWGFATSHRDVNPVRWRTRRHWFADLKADMLARWVSKASDQRLESVMRSRLRVVLLWAIFRTIGQRAEPDARLDAVVEFEIMGRRDGGVDRYQLKLAGGRCRTSRGGERRPALTLQLRPVAFLRLVGGTASAQRLWLAGTLKLRGDLLLAVALPGALRLPTRRRRAPTRNR